MLTLVISTSSSLACLPYRQDTPLELSVTIILNFEEVVDGSHTDPTNELCFPFSGSEDTFKKIKEIMPMRLRCLLKTFLMRLNLYG